MRAVSETLPADPLAESLADVFSYLLARRRARLASAPADVELGGEHVKAALPDEHERGAVAGAEASPRASGA